MKNRIIGIVLGLILVPSVAMSERWDGATWDPSSGSSSSYTSPTCADIDRSDTVRWNVLGCGGQRAPLFPNGRPEISANQEPEWRPPENNRYQPSTPAYGYSNEVRQRRAWSAKVAQRTIDVWVDRYASYDGTSPYLSEEMMADIDYRGYQFQEALNQCLAGVIYNDQDTVDDMINQRMGERLLDYLAGSLRNCYRRVR